jgi:hypothetical protein
MPFQQVTLATLQQELEDKWESVPFWTAAEATVALNEGLRLWNMFTAQWKQRITIATGAGQVWYSLPSTMIFNMRFEFDQFPVEQSTIGDLDNGRPNWEAETTATGADVPTRPSLWAPAGLNLFAIWPADNAGGGSLVVDGVRSTPVLVNPGDFVDLGQHEHHAILGYALHHAAFKEGGQRWQATMRHYQEFIKAAGDLNARLRASTFFRKIMGLDLNRNQRTLKAPPDQPQPPGPQGQGA